MRLLQALAGTDIGIIAVMDKVASSNGNGEVIRIDLQIPEADCIVIVGKNEYSNCVDTKYYET